MTLVSIGNGKLVAELPIGREVLGCPSNLLVSGREHLLV